MQKIAEVCKEKNLTALELDLSENMGGDSAVIDEFIKYTHVNTYRRYEMLDFSSGSPVCVASREDDVTNQKQDILFPKKIFCRVSNTTFSSARTFAVTLKDNGIATITGEPTGGKPCSYGMPKRDVTPNLNIRFRVSRALFLRPNADLEEEDALFPDGKKKHKVVCFFFWYRKSGCSKMRPDFCAKPPKNVEKILLARNALQPYNEYKISRKSFSSAGSAGYFPNKCVAKKTKNTYNESEEIH